jgi:N utilization substance protein A
MISDLKRMIDQMSREKGVEPQVVVKTLEEAVKAAALRRFGPGYDIEVAYQPEQGEIEVFEYKEVVEFVTDENKQISVEEGREFDPECQVGDILGIKMSTEAFGRIAAQAAKQIIMTKLKNAERDVVYDDFKDRRGEIINGIVQSFDRGAIIVNLGRTEAVIPPKEQIPRESYRQGDRVRAYILDVNKKARGPQIILSRTHPNFLSALFQHEVPEIADGIVKIIQVAREPGSRSKISVASRDPDVDPVGACVGIKGSRVQAVVQELRGEKIDIVPWDPDPAKLVCNALAPAEIIRVIVDETEHSMEVVVPDDQQSLAIGRRGQNVNLASKLTGWRLNVISEKNYNKALKESYSALLSIEGVGEKLAAELYQYGFRSPADVAAGSISDLMAIGGMTEEKAEAIKEAAKSADAQKEAQGEQVKRIEDIQEGSSEQAPAEER